MIFHWVYNECATELSYVLCKLINFSINEGAVPNVEASNHNSCTKNASVSSNVM